MNTAAPATPDQQETHKKARELYIQGKLYRALATAFAMLGLLAAAFLYYNGTKGDFRHIMENPTLLLVMVIPFLPAVVLSLKAKKAESGYMKLLNEKA